MISITYKGGSSDNYRIANSPYKSLLLSYIISRSQRSFKLLNQLKGKKSDAEIYKIVSSAPIVKSRDTHFMNKNIQLLNENIPPQDNETILDIGTEELTYLDELQKSRGCNAYGINIHSDFAHYTDKFAQNETDQRFQIYNGHDIPHPDSTFDTITIFSVLHHVPLDVLPILIKDIKRVLKPGGHIFIKENDIKSKAIRDVFNIQHEIYEGSIMAGTPSYRNDKQRIVNIIRLFDIPLVNRIDLNNFSGVSYLVFTKN